MGGTGSIPGQGWGDSVEAWGSPGLLQHLPPLPTPPPSQLCSRASVFTAILLPLSLSLSLPSPDWFPVSRPASPLLTSEPPSVGFITQPLSFLEVGSSSCVSSHRESWGDRTLQGPSPCSPSPVHCLLSGGVLPAARVLEVGLHAHASHPHLDASAPAGPPMSFLWGSRHTPFAQKQNRAGGRKYPILLCPHPLPAAMTACPTRGGTGSVGTATHTGVKSGARPSGRTATGLRVPTTGGGRGTGSHTGPASMPTTATNAAPGLVAVPPR